MASLTWWIVAIAVAYLCGALPFGLWLGQWFKRVDVRTLGSGNLGATNVYRSLGPALGIATLALDMAKGALPTALIPRLPPFAGLPGAAEWGSVVVGLAAVAGHVWTVFAGFRGGKGVATSAGVLFALAPLACGVCVVVFVITVATTRFISLGSILAALTLPVAIALLTARGARGPVFVLGTLLAIAVVVRHRENIGRLMRGEEPRFGFSRAKTT